MTKTFTPNDVIRIIYGEVISVCEKQELLDALNSNSELYDFYCEMSAMKKSLSKIKKEPSKSSVDRILQFSKNYQPRAVSN